MKNTTRQFSLIVLLLVGNASRAQCYFPSSTAVSDQVTFTHSGGSFISSGCAPIDPTYWMSGNGMSITATFTAPADLPSIRLWGMNNDDTARVSVNGVYYPMTALSASIGPKVICGIAPGPDGMFFGNGLIYGTPEGNYSYQDITLNMTDVSTILVEGLAGAGWGFGGVVVDCPAGIDELPAGQPRLFPNPTTGLLQLDRQLTGALEVLVMNGMGQVVLRTSLQQDQLDLSALSAGVYAVTIVTGQGRYTQQVVKS